jgi:hypothetical protein
MRRRGLLAPLRSSPTPILRPKRATRALARFNRTIRVRRRIKERGDRCDYYLYTKSASFTLSIY